MDRLLSTVVLDTHVVHWWSAEPERVSRRAAAALSDAEELAVAAITWWELAWLARHERIRIAIPLRTWLDRLAEHVRTLPLTPGQSRALRGYFRNGFNPITVSVLGKEMVKVGSGASVRCLHLSVSAAGRTSELWITDDARRIPARATVPLPIGGATLTWDGR